MLRTLPLLVLLGCQPADPPDPEPISRPFPDGFLWGSATASLQVDAGCPTLPDALCVDTASDWYQWITSELIVGTPALHVTGEDIRHAPGMWELFESDYDRMQADGHTGYRLSLEWSRFFPDGAAEAATSVEELAPLANPDAVDTFHRKFAALRARGITPLVTLSHNVLPVWVHDGVACHYDIDGCTARGWIDRDRIVRLIGLYAGWVGQEFGGDEPVATTLGGYLQPGEDRSAPPGVTLSRDWAVPSLLNQVDGHAAMYDALKAFDVVDADGDGAEAEVGIVMNLVDMRPLDPANPADVASTAHADHLYHRIVLDGVTAGSWDGDADGVFEATRPELAGRLDFLGVNYYNELVIRALSVRPLGDAAPAFDFYPEFSWEPHPEGLARVLEIAAGYGVPIYITENGTPHVDRAVELLDGHLGSLWSAIDSGIDVRGYLYWSWVDNYEWNHGMNMRFGLYGLDPDTKARIERPVARRYREIIAQGGLEQARRR
jgi:beta-galactosidase